VTVLVQAVLCKRNIEFTFEVELLKVEGLR
jgi:hypothetical protein